MAVEHDEELARDVSDALGCRAVVGSVDDPDLWTRAVEAAEETGGLDVVYLNAGRYGWTGPIDELPLDLYRETLGANIDGVVLGTRAVVPALRARGGGAIVATASIAGLVAFAPNPIYTLTKHAVVGFVEATAPNLAADHISFDAVCPSVVDTPMTVEALGGADPAAMGFPMIDPLTIARTALGPGHQRGHRPVRGGAGRRRPVRVALPQLLQSPRLLAGPGLVHTVDRVSIAALPSNRVRHRRPTSCAGVWSTGWRWGALIWG